MTKQANDNTLVEELCSVIVRCSETNLHWMIVNSSPIL